MDSVGYPVYGEVTAPPLWNALCLVLPGKLFTYLIGFLLMAGGAFLVHRVNYALMLIREDIASFSLLCLVDKYKPGFLSLEINICRGVLFDIGPLSVIYLLS